MTDTPNIDRHIGALNWELVAGEPEQRRFRFLGGIPEGEWTITALDQDAEVTVEPALDDADEVIGDDLIATWTDTQTALLLSKPATQWRLRQDGLQRAGGTLVAAHPQVVPGDSTITVEVGGGSVVEVTVIASGGGGGAPLSDDDPAALGEVASGESIEASRSDHVHPMPTAADVGADPAGAAAAAAGAITAASLGAAPTSRTITAGAGLTGGGDLTADRTLAADFGTGAGKVTEGNDARLSDGRLPLVSVTPPADPEVGDLWWKGPAIPLASMDYRLLPDGMVPDQSNPVDPPSWVPGTNGPGTLDPLTILDIGSLVPGIAPLTVEDGAARAPLPGDAEDVRVVPNFVLPTGPTGVVRLSAGLDDWQNITYEEGYGSSVNVTLTSAADPGVGPIVHFAVVGSSESPVTRVKVGFDTPSPNVDSLTRVLPVPLGRGDRGALVIDVDARRWWPEVNGKDLGIWAELQDDGEGGENVVGSSGDLIANLAAPLDFSFLQSASTPTNVGSADDGVPPGWRGGTRWWAYSTDDYDPDAVTLMRYSGVGGGWVPVTAAAP